MDRVVGQGDPVGLGRPILIRAAGGGIDYRLCPTAGTKLSTASWAMAGWTVLQSALLNTLTLLSLLATIGLGYLIATRR